MTRSDPEVLTLREFAKFMAIHYMSARTYANSGLLADFGAYRLPSGYWRIPRAGAEQFRAKLQAEAPHPNGPAVPAKAPKRKTVKRPARKR